MAQETNSSQPEDIEKLAEAARKTPQDSNAWYRLGMAQQQAFQRPGEFEKLMATARHMTERWPKDPRGWNLLGNALYANTDRADAAVAAWRRATVLDPNYTAPWYNLGRYYLLAERNPEGAIEAINWGLKIAEPTYQDRTKLYNVWGTLGDAYKETGRLEDALQAYRTATRMNPSNEWACISLSQVLCRKLAATNLDLQTPIKALSDRVAADARRWGEATAAAQDGIRYNPGSTNLGLLTDVKALSTRAAADDNMLVDYLAALCASQVADFSNFFTAATSSDLAEFSSLLVRAAGTVDPSSSNLLVLTSAKLGRAESESARADAVATFSKFIWGATVAEEQAFADFAKRTVTALGSRGTTSTGASRITFADKIVSFTNLQGQVYRDVKVVTADRDGLVWVEQGDSFGGGRICYTNLPAGLCMTLGIRAEWFANARARAGGEALRDSRQRRLTAYSAQAEAATRKARKDVEATKDHAAFRVIQRIGNSALVDRGGSTLYVMDCPDKWVDGDWVQADIYPIGTHDYTTVTGASRRVRRYTCSLEKAVAAH